MKQRPSPIALLLVIAVRGYQLLISPGLPRRCKYYPSCSQYAIDALKTYGVARGLVLAGWRLLRCNPWSYGGYDPIERQKVFGRVRRLQGDWSAEADWQARTACQSQHDPQTERGFRLRLGAWRRECQSPGLAAGWDGAASMTDGQ